MTQAFSNLGDTPIVEGIFHRARTGPVDAVRYIAQTVIGHQSTPTLLFFIAARRNVGIFQHQPKGFLVVDACQPFDEGIGNDHLGMTPTLCAPIAVAAAGIGHIAVVLSDIDECIDDVTLPVGVDERDEWHRCAIGVPEGIEIVVVRRSDATIVVSRCEVRGTRCEITIVPRRVLPGTVGRHEHGVVECCIEHPLLLNGSFYPDATQQIVPLTARRGQLFVERTVGNVTLGL